MIMLFLKKIYFNTYSYVDITPWFSNHFNLISDTKDENIKISPNFYKEKILKPFE